MLPVWQEVPHHSVGLGLMLNCAKRLSTEPRVNLYHISSPFLCKTACTYVHDQAETNIWEWGSLVMHEWVQTPTLFLSASLCLSRSLSFSQLVICLRLSQRCSIRPYTLAEIKVLVWQDIFLTLLLSRSSCLRVSFSPILTISQCCYWNVCVLVRTVKLMNDQPWQIHSPDPGAAGEETNGKLGLWRSQS